MNLISKYGKIHKIGKTELGSGTLEKIYGYTI
jgi:hypothetical protein